LAVVKPSWNTKPMPAAEGDQRRIKLKGPARVAYALMGGWVCCQDRPLLGLTRTLTVCFPGFILSYFGGWIHRFAKPPSFAGVAQVW
jgi:hypothetical protein